MSQDNEQKINAVFKCVQRRMLVADSLMFADGFQTVFIYIWFSSYWLRFMSEFGILRFC